MESKDIIYQCLDPRGNLPDIEYQPPSKRLTSLDDKTIFFVDIGKTGSDILINTVMNQMQAKAPKARLVYYSKKVGFMQQESEDWWNTIKEQADAAVVAVGD